MYIPMYALLFAGILLFKHIFVETNKENDHEWMILAFPYVWFVSLISESSKVDHLTHFLIFLACWGCAILALRSSLAKKFGRAIWSYGFLLLALILVEQHK